MSNATQLLADDPFATSLGVQLLSSADGEISVSLVIGSSHANFVGVGHGAVLFGLADVALSLISNRERTALAVDAHLALLAPVHVGDTLVAVARPVREGRTMATYRVDIATETGRKVGAFTGTVHIPTL